MLDGDTAGVQVETVAGRSSIELTIPASPATLLERLRRGVGAQRRFSLTEIHGSIAHLNARVNWATWGARVEVRLVSLDPETTRVEARWAPAIGTTLLIWGQGARDLRAIASMLSE